MFIKSKLKAIECSSSRKETADIDILITSRNGHEIYQNIE